MNKRILILCILLLLALALSGCADTHTVTFVLGDGREPVSVDVASDSELYSPEPPEGYVFGGWFLDAERTRPHLSGKITEDMTLYARFVKRGEVVVTFIYDNGMPDTTLVMSGTLTQPVDPVRAGYVFDGWIDCSTGTRYPFGTAPVTPHTVLKANWRPASEGVVLTVHPNNGESVSTVKLEYAATPSEPLAPSSLDYDFLGWYADAECKTPFDFTKPLTKDTDIYAGWGIDLNAVGNRVAAEVLPTSVKIKAVLTNLAGSHVSTGSGVIYGKLAGRYYALTNEHVVDPDVDYISSQYTVTDAYGIEYRGVCVAKSAEYDLAVIRFDAAGADLPVAKFAKEDPKVGDFLISVGNPDGLSNAVTYGEVIRYHEASVSGGEVSFKVGWHDAPLDQGSSGGAVFNTNMQIVGINFAAAKGSDGSFVNGAFIQLSRVFEFLTYYNVVIN